MAGVLGQYAFHKYACLWSMGQTKREEKMDRDAAIAERASQAESAGSHCCGPISVFLITLNEAAHIEQVLSSVAWAD